MLTLLRPISNRTEAGHSIRSRSLAWCLCSRTVLIILTVRVLFYVLRFCQCSNHTFCFLQMTTNSHFGFQRVHHVQLLQPLVRFPRFHRLPPFPTRRARRKRQPGLYRKIRTERTNGKVQEVHVVTDIIHPLSDHLALGIRSSFRLRRQQRAIRRGGV